MSNNINDLINNLCNTLDKFVITVEDMQSRQSEFIHRKVQNCIGDDGHMLYHDEDAAYRLLTDVRFEHRLGALLVLVFHWGSTPKLAQAAAHLLVSEPVPEIRNLAITALGNCYAMSQNLEVCQIFKLLIDSELETLSVRRAAKDAYENVMGKDGNPFDQFIKLANQVETQESRAEGGQQAIRKRC